METIRVVGIAEQIERQLFPATYRDGESR